MPESDVQVTYGVKELLAEIKKEQAEGFASLERGLRTKADKSDLAEIRGEMKAVRDEHGKRLSELEKERDERRAAGEAHGRIIGARKEWQRWVIPTLLTGVFTVVAIVQALHP